MRVVPIRLNANITRMSLCMLKKIGWMVAALLLMGFASARATDEDVFETLQIGTRVYTNVTVTTKAKDYIFILHSGGMTSIKTAELPQEIQDRLGYVSEEKAHPASTNSAAAWAKAEVAKLEGERVQEMRRPIVERWKASKDSGQPKLGTLLAVLPIKVIVVFLAVLLVFFLFHSFCLFLICRKAGYEPGVLVWLPIVQLIPMVRAAQMPVWWVIAWFIPVANIIAMVVWCFKIAEARGKTPLTAILLLLPITGPFAFLYLAFSAGAVPPESSKREPEIMSLQTA